MSAANILDTLLNIGVFVFIGVLFWLYQKPVAEAEKQPSKDPDES
jgi:hypothetical protein